MYTILYTKKGITYDDNTDGKSYLSICASKNHKNIHKIDIEYKHKHEHTTVTLNKNIISSFYYSIVNYENCNNANMWDKVKHIDKDDFVYGFISYITLFFLFEQTTFMSLLPMVLDVPCTLTRGDCCDAQVMKYMDKALKGMISSINNKFVYHYISFVQQFIHKYCKMFHIGPMIDKYYHTKLDVALSKITQKETYTCTTTSNTCDNTNACATTTNTNDYNTSSYDCNNTSTCDTTNTCNNTSCDTNTCDNTSCSTNTCDNTSYDNTSEDYCSTCEERLYHDQSCEITPIGCNNMIQLTFEQKCNAVVNLTEADKAYIRQMIREEIQKLC